MQNAPKENTLNSQVIRVTTEYWLVCFDTRPPGGWADWRLHWAIKQNKKSRVFFFVHISMPFSQALESELIVHNLNSRRDELAPSFSDKNWNSQKTLIFTVFGQTILNFSPNTSMRVSSDCRRLVSTHGLLVNKCPQGAAVLWGAHVPIVLRQCTCCYLTQCELGIETNCIQSNCRSF